MAKYLILFLSVITFSQAEVSVIDDRGREVTLQQPAKRIISLAPHITESLFAAGAGDNIVGAMEYSDYPEAARKIPRVGGYASLDIEKIVSLKPDLIVVWSSGNNLKEVEKLEALGLTVFMSEPYYPKDIANNIKRFGILTGNTNISSTFVDKYLNHYKRLQKDNEKKEKIKVFYQFWNKPIMTINGKHLISQIINLCGGINVFSELPSLTPKISVEAVIASNTDAIIAGDIGSRKLLWMSEWKQWTQIPAVRKKQIYFINPDLINRAGPRILQGADELCGLLDKARN